MGISQVGDDLPGLDGARLRVCRTGMEHARLCGPVYDAQGNQQSEYCACGCSADDYWCMTDAETDPVHTEDYYNGEPGTSVQRYADKGTSVQRYADKAMFEATPMTDTKPKVHLLWMTPDPLGAIAAMYEMYKGNPIFDLSQLTDDQRREAFEETQKTHLTAPFEAVKLHFMIEGVNRSFCQQLTRQRTAVYAMESLRFAVKEDEAVSMIPFPPSFSDPRVYGNLSGQNDLHDLWINGARHAVATYHALIAKGVPAEDARDVLPMGTLTRTNYVTDLRNLADHAGNRLCTQAQFVWKAVFQGIREAIRQYEPDFSFCADSFDEDMSVGDAAREQWAEMQAWQFEAIADSKLFSPICFKTGKCEFASNMDRGCTIRERVDNGEFNMITPDEWASDPQAGWVR